MNDSTAIDPVCGMQVDRAEATAKGLTAEHQGQAYYFCGRGCFLDFTENPEPYFAADYTPSM
ncbi:MAG TPA: YHS domain-containing protein [Candidatus Limnocylindria bacterium]|nr:YHS domain-containing protein [Candidatus Limnocylindria bacterium]